MPAERENEIRFYLTAKRAKVSVARTIELAGPSRDECWIWIADAGHTSVRHIESGLTIKRQMPMGCSDEGKFHAKAPAGSKFVADIVLSTEAATPALLRVTSREASEDRG